jgi:hypothetical protein
MYGLAVELIIRVRKQGGQWMRCRLVHCWVVRSRSNVCPVADVASQHSFAATGLAVWVFRPVSSKLTTEGLLKQEEETILRFLCMVKTEEGDLSVECAIFVFVPCLPPIIGHVLVPATVPLFGAFPYTCAIPCSTNCSHAHTLQLCRILPGLSSFPPSIAGVHGK